MQPRWAITVLAFAVVTVIVVVVVSAQTAGGPAPVGASVMPTQGQGRYAAFRLGEPDRLYLLDSASGAVYCIWGSQLEPWSNPNGTSWHRLVEPLEK